MSVNQQAYYLCYDELIAMYLHVHTMNDETNLRTVQLGISHLSPLHLTTLILQHENPKIYQ